MVNLQLYLTITIGLYTTVLNGYELVFLIEPFVDLKSFF